MQKLHSYLVCLLCLKYKLTDTYIHVDKLYTLQVYLRQWTRPYTYICSASVQKAELKVVEVLKLRTWGGAGVSVLVCTRGAGFEMDWWMYGVFQ